jgi:hypothetical protein
MDRKPKREKKIEIEPFGYTQPSLLCLSQQIVFLSLVSTLMFNSSFVSFSFSV